MVANQFTRADQEDFWLKQPKVLNLIASKESEQLYGFFRTHVALYEKRSAMWASGKLFNDADGLIWSTEGPFSGPAGHRFGSLVVNQTTARPVPCQQTQKTGQTHPCKSERL
ncbi:MAG: hypothetical protein ACR2OL_19805 [Anderseniella sp.]